MSPANDRQYRRASLRAAVVVALVYLVLGVAWILFSDAVAGALVSDPETFQLVSSVKGTAYVVVTAVLGFVIALHLLRRRAEMARALAASEEGYRNVLDAVNDAVFVHDFETGELLDVNRRMLDLFEVQREHVNAELMHRLCGDDPDYSPAHVAMWLERARQEGPQVFEWHAHRLDGSRFWIEIHLHCSRLAGQRCILAIARDIDARKRDDEERAALAATHQEALRLEQVGMLAGGVAHDFNNLLTGILGNAELAKLAAAPGGDIAFALDEITAAGRRAAELTKQLLAYSGRGGMVQTRFCPNKTVADSAALLRTTVGRRVTLELELADDTPPVEGDPGQFDHMLLNLLLNAADAMGPHTGNVRIRTGRKNVDREFLTACEMGEELAPGTFAFLEVEDDGVGVEPAIRRRVFDPFFSTKEHGRGLGLSAVQGVVRSHGGAIRLDSAPGKGTTVTVLLPPAEPNVLSASSSRWKRLDPRTLETHAREGIALIADDDDAVRSLVARFLRAAGFETVEAGDGEEAIALFEKSQRPFCIAILDLTMPRMDGREAFERLRESAPDLPVLMISGFDEGETAAQLADSPRVDVLQKPFNRALLLQRIDKLLEG